MEHEAGTMNRDTLVYERFRRYFDFMQLELDPLSTQEKYLKALGSRPYLMPGANEILSSLGPHVSLGYITNGMSTVQRPRLELLGWHLRFDIIVIAGEIGCSKPHFDYFHHVHLQMKEPDKSKVLVVGDSLTADIAGGASYGYHTCWYNPASVHCEHERKPDYTIAQLGELKSIVLDH
jgi:2-haloacid dehalogenase